MAKIKTSYFPFENRSLKITSSFDKNNKRTIRSECKSCGNMEARDVITKLCCGCFKKEGYKTCYDCGSEFNYEGRVTQYGDDVCDNC